MRTSATALDTYPVAEASTAHLTNGDRLLLESACAKDSGLDLSIRGHEWGWLIHCGDLHQDAERVSRIRAFGLSNDLVSLLLHASAQGARWLDLDCDATRYDNRASFTW